MSRRSMFRRTRLASTLRGLYLGIIVSFILLYCNFVTTVQVLIHNSYGLKDGPNIENFNPKKPTLPSRESSNTKIITQNTKFRSVHDIHDNNRNNFRNRLIWRSAESALNEELSSISEDLKQTIFKIIPKVNISASCSTSLLILADSLSAHQLWASQMLDSSAKHIPSGMFSGVLNELGNFDQCLQTEFPSKSSDEPQVVGQYCSIIIKPPIINDLRVKKLRTMCSLLNPNQNNIPPYRRANQSLSYLFRYDQKLQYMNLRLGLCTPSSCSRVDLQQILNNFLFKYRLQGLIKTCQIKDIDQTFTFDAQQIGLVIGFSILISLSLLATLIDCILIDSSRDAKNNLQNLKRFKNNRTSTCLRNKRLLINDQEHWDYRVYRANGDPETIGSFGHFHSAIEAQKNPLHKLDYVGYMEHKKNFSINGIDPKTYEELKIEKTSLENRNGTANVNQVKLDIRHLKDSNRNRFQEYLIGFVSCFSIIGNLHQVFKIDKNIEFCGDISHGPIPIVHGLKTISMLWIVFGNLMGSASSDIMNTLFQISELACSSRLFQALLNSSLAIDTLFMLSGVLTIIGFHRRSLGISLGEHGSRNQSSCKAASYIITSSIDTDLSYNDLFSSSSSPLGSSSSSNNVTARNSQGRVLTRNRSGDGRKIILRTFRPFVWLIMRYLRLTPTYLFVIGLAILLPSLGSGPFWIDVMGQLAPQNCRTSWWTNMIYMNNHLQSEKICLQHSWYLSNIMQFYILALVLFGLYYYSFKQTSLFIWILTFALSTATTFVQTSMYEFPPSILPTKPSNQLENIAYRNMLFYKPWPHLPSFLVGILTGYSLLATNRSTERPLGQTWRFLAWILCLLIAFSLLNSLYPWNMGLDMDVTVSALHGSTFRTLWSICCALLVHELSLDQKSFLSRFLGWPGFQLPSRLTFCAYLLNPLVIAYCLGSVRDRLDASISHGALSFLGVVVLTYISASMVSLIIEIPTNKIQVKFSRWIIKYLAKNTECKSDKNAKNDDTKAGSSPSFDSDWSVASAQGPKSTEPKTINSHDRTHKVRMESFSKPLDIKSTRIKEMDVNSQSYISTDSVPNTNRRLVDTNSESQVRTHQTLNSSLDVDFQRKLAYAVSRGFKLRSKMAMAQATSELSKHNFNSNHEFIGSKPQIDDNKS